MVFLTLLVRAGANAVKKPFRDAYVIGVGMTKFEKPGARVNYDYPEMSKEAGTAALNDAKIKYEEVEQAVCGYVYGDSTCGQRAVYGLGMTGIPVYNVNNNCSTGSTALMMARQFVQGGSSECVLALGFEKMERGSLSMKFPDRVSPLDKHEKKIRELEPEESASGAPIAPFYFGAAAKEYMQKYPGTRVEQMAAVAAKNHLHSVHNPYSQFTFPSTVQEVLASPRVAFALTKLQCCPTSDGAAAAVVASEDFVKSHGLEDRAVRIVGQEMVTDMENSFGNSPMYVAGYGMAKRSAELLYRNTGLSPKDFQVVEIHDCFSANEMITYEALGLCEVGKAGEFVERTWLGRDGPVCNPCGGLISKGHPLGATGLAQCAELCWQLRGLCGVRQVPRVKYALQHNIGLGGAVVLTAYTLGWPERVARDPQTGIAAGLGKGKNELPPHEKALHEILARAQYVKKEAKGGASKRKSA